LLALGQLFLALGLVSSHFADKFDNQLIVDFFAGVFIGLSIVFNLYYLIRFRKDSNG